MPSDEFEQCFSDFIDRREYDDAQNAFFSVVRSSFKAGWESAGGKPPPAQPVIRFAPKAPKD